MEDRDFRRERGINALLKEIRQKGYCNAFEGLPRSTPVRE